MKCPHCGWLVPRPWRFFDNVIITGFLAALVGSTEKLPSWEWINWHGVFWVSVIFCGFNALMFIWAVCLRIAHPNGWQGSKY